MIMITDNVTFVVNVLLWKIKQLYTKCLKVVFLAHLSRRLIGELIVYPLSGVRSRCRRSPFSSISISNTYRPNATKFYLKHHLGE